MFLPFHQLITQLIFSCFFLGNITNCYSLSMNGKRFHDEPGSDPDQPSEKRARNKPSFASVIGEAVMVNSMKNFFMVLEPMLRRVVSQEVESTLLKCSRFPNQSASNSMQMQTLEPSGLGLIFGKKPSLPIYTGSKILDCDGSPLQIFLVDTRSGDHQIMVPTCLPHPIKLEIVVLDGDFPTNDANSWTSQEFNNNVVKERAGKRPLLAGDYLTITLRDGFAAVGDVEFTDNSSWIRSRKFRIGVRVVPGSQQSVVIREAMTDAFVVKDHRGELYKKHHPPMLGDEVWRLEKIGKDGAFHKKLAAEGVNTVQNFLKMFIVEPQKLRRILGPGMSEKMWEVTIKHARTCDLGNKHYIFRRPNYVLGLNPICQVVHAVVHGKTYSTRDLSTLSTVNMQNLVRQAYANWYTLEEVVGVSSETLRLTQGEDVDDEQGMVKSFAQTGYDHRYCIEMGNAGCHNWQLTSSTLEPNLHYSITESSSDGEFTPKELDYGL